jgi:Polyketide cyclase / dehydrase and lipid transport
MHDSVTVHMQAPADRIFELVSDVTRIGEFSPETFEAEWLDGATGPAVGGRFKGHVKRNGRGPVYWTNCEIIACDPGKEFTFAVSGPGGRVANTWSYTFVPKEDGTDVTESFRLSDTIVIRLFWMTAGWARGPANVRGMRTTLERIKAAVESPGP